MLWWHMLSRVTHPREWSKPIPARSEVSPKTLMALGDIQLSCGQAFPAAPCPTSPRDNNKGTRPGSTPYNHSRLFVRLINPSCTSVRLALASGPGGLSMPILGDKTPCWNNLDKTIHGFRWAFLLGVLVTQGETGDNLLESSNQGAGARIATWKKRIVIPDGAEGVCGLKQQTGSSAI